jgi:hypothetical protein
MFEEMIGIKDADKEIILPKFVKVRNIARHIYKVLIQFSAFEPLQANFPEWHFALKEIGDFAAQLKESVYFGDVDDTEEQYADMTKETMNEVYRKLKESAIIKQLIIQCGTLKRYHKYLENMETLRDNFIGQEPGLSFVIFNFSSLDIKKLWVHSNIRPIVKKYVLTVLHLLYKDIMQMFRIVTSPDVDIDKFTAMLLQSIQEIKKQPALSRCNRAFYRIEKSVSLLKEKFDDYYRESIASSNPNIIVESFIVDVSNQGGTDARLTREFRQIIMYMQKVSEQNGRNKDPHVQKLFSMLNKNFEAMEKGTSAKTTADTTTSATETKDDSTKDVNTLSNNKDNDKNDDKNDNKKD